MKSQKAIFCTICGEPRRHDDRGFMLTENRWTDRLKILSWNDALVTHPEAYPACGAAHAQQLVVHWMTMGSLEYPFARVGTTRTLGRKRRHDALTGPTELDTRGTKLIGELAVHRESLSRVLLESPDPWQAFLRP